MKNHTTLVERWYEKSYSQNNLYPVKTLLRLCEQGESNYIQVTIKEKVMKDNKYDKLNNKVREIEFRGKRKIDNTWIYGGYMKTARTNKIQVGGTSRFCTVYPETLGEYTGRKDKNGASIFEGDIVKGTITSAWAKQEIVCVVKYLGNAFVSIEDNKWEHSLMFAKNIEVIGNIYDNPELLGGSYEECDN